MLVACLKGMNAVSKTDRRIPYNYDGTGVTTRQVSDLLSMELTKLGEVFQGRHDLVLAAWPEVIGPKLSVMTEAISFHKGVLTVKVRNSTLHSLLSCHNKSQILTAIKQKFPKANIQNIVFRIG